MLLLVGKIDVIEADAVLAQTLRPFPKDIEILRYQDMGEGRTGYGRMQLEADIRAVCRSER